MRYLYTCLVASFFVFTGVNAQHAADSIFKYSFPPGAECPYDLTRYIRAQAKYPQDAREQQIEGRVIVRFTIDSSGFARNVFIAKAVYPSLDSLAVRVIRNMPHGNHLWQMGDGSKHDIAYLSSSTLNSLSPILYTHMTKNALKATKFDL